MLSQQKLERYCDILESKALATLVTLMPDGGPQATPIWFEFDGKHLLVNAARGKVKDRNMRQDARVAVLIIDPENVYRYVQIRGQVVEISEEGADEHIDRLSQKYLGLPSYPDRRQDEVRVLYRIAPDHVSGIG